MKDLSYKTVFGKNVSHEEELKNRIKGSIINIIMEEEMVSEKSFKKIDEISNRVNTILDENLFLLASKMYAEGKRIKYIAEMLYEGYIKNSSIKESFVTKFKDFTK